MIRPPGADVSPLSPCKAGGPGPRVISPPGSTSAPPAAACGSSAATMAHGWVRGRGCGCARWSHGDWRRRRAWGSPCSPAPWGCAGSWEGAGVRGHVDRWIRTLPRGWVGVHAGGGNGASAGPGQTPGAGSGGETLLVAPGVAAARSKGGGLWARGAGFAWCWDKVRHASAVARSTIKVVAAGLGGCLELGLGYYSASVGGFAGVRCRPALPVAGPGAAGALAVAAARAAGTGLVACVDGVSRSLVDGVPGEGVVEVEVDEVVVVVEVGESEAEETDVGDGGRSWVESEAEKTDVGDGGGSRTAGSGAGCLVLWARRVRMRIWASGVCARFWWRPVCVQVPVPWVVSCVVCGGVVELPWMRGFLSYSGGGVHVSSTTCGSDCWRQGRVPKQHRWMPGISSSVRWG